MAKKAAKKKASPFGDRVPGPAKKKAIKKPHRCHPPAESFFHELRKMGIKKLHISISLDL